MCMLKYLLIILVAVSTLMAAGELSAQPFDLIIPGEDSPDSLSRELRKIQAIERDLALEKLTREPGKLEAYIELAELRRTQGKLQEAQRFYEMALEISPNNMQANQGLAMVHYHKGEFNLARYRIEKIHSNTPISDQLNSQLENYRANLRNEAQMGVSVREDDRGLSEIISSIEGYFPSHEYKKMKGRYRFENWNHSDNGVDVSTQVYSGTIDYHADQNSSISLTYAPEIYASTESMSGYHGQLITGTDNLKIALRTGKNSFRENLFTVKNRMYEESNGLSLFGDLHKRTRIVQSVTATDLSDGNSRRRFDSEIIHSVFRNNAPFLSTNLRIYQISYEKQLDPSGSALQYWTPSDFKGAELTFSWERKVGANWWWGLDTSLSTSQHRSGGQSYNDSGAGAAVLAGYRFSTGSLYFSLGDKFQDYYRERKLEIYGSITF